MNRNKPILKVAGLLLVVGLALYFVGMAAFASESPAQGGKATQITYAREEYSVQAEGISRINVRTRNMAVTVTPAKGSEITIHYCTSEEDPYEVSLEGGELTLKYKYENLFSVGSWFSNVSIFNVINNTAPSVEVIVPEAYANALQLHTSNASIRVSGLIGAGDVRMETSNSTIDVSNVTATGLAARTSNGPVTLDRLIVAGTVDARSSNGPLTAKQVAAKDGLVLHTSNGRIVVDQITSAAIELRSSNAGISGSVAGKRSDYTVSSDTSNADNSLGDGGSGPSRLTVDTSNGAINVKFQDN